MCFGVRLTFSLYLASWLSDFDLFFFCVCGFWPPCFFPPENGGGGQRPPPHPGSAPGDTHFCPLKGERIFFIVEEGRVFIFLILEIIGGERIFFQK